MALVGLGSKAQNVIFGTVRYDGFNKITKGAFWASRPEAKRVYLGENPEGVEVIILDQDYFVRFVEAEHNNFDRNYIVFPKGQKLYKKNNKVYAAICGNEVEFYQPVENTKIVEKTTILNPATAAGNIFFDPPKREEKNTNPIFIPDPVKEGKKKSFKIGWVIIPAAAILTGTVTYLLLRGKSNGPLYGGPGGAPPSVGYR